MYSKSIRLLTAACSARPREDCFFCSPQAHSGARLGTCRWCSLLKEMSLEEPLQGQERPKQKGLFLLSLHPGFGRACASTFIETRLLEVISTQAQLPRLQAVPDQSRLLVSRQEPEPRGGGGQRQVGGWRSRPQEHTHGQQRSVSTWRAGGLLVQRLWGGPRMGPRALHYRSTHHFPI